MRRYSSIPVLLLVLAATACDSTTGLEDASVDPSETAVVPTGFPGASAAQLTLGTATALTAGAADQWPQLEGDFVAWYRAQPAAEEGIWVMDLRTSTATRVWPGRVSSDFEMNQGQVFWGDGAGLYRYDIASGGLETLDGTFRDYGQVAAGDGWITARASDNAARPFFMNRLGGDGTLFQTPTRITGARGWGDYLVWSDLRAGFAVAELQMLHLPSGTETQITETGQYLDASAARVGGGRVVYFPARFCPGTLMVREIESGVTTPVELPGVSCPEAADLEGDLLVYRERRSGGMIGVGVVDLVTGEREEFELQDPGTRRIDVDLDLSNGQRAVHTSANGLVLLELETPPEPPVAVPGGPYEVMEGSALVLDGSGSFSLNDAALAYSWDMGDGTIVEGTPTPEHAWEDDGSYTVVLTVSETTSGGEVLSTTAETTVAVTNAAPLVFVSRDLEGVVGEELLIEASFTDAGSSDGPWSWSLLLGQIELASGSADAAGDIGPVRWRPDEAGSFTLVLQVTDKDGDVGEATSTVAVASPARVLPAALRIHAGSGEKHNIPNLASNGVFQVVVFGMDLLGMDEMDVASFRLGDAGVRPAQEGEHAPAMEDRDGDGLADLVLSFRARTSGLVEGQTEVCLTGETLEGDSLTGCSPVRIAGSSNRRNENGNGRE